MSKLRPDEVGQHHTTYKKNKKRILATQDICAWCGKPVDKTLKFPDPMSPSIDHIVPECRGGHPSAIENLQLMHLMCNREKGSKMAQREKQKVETKNRNLPLSCDWTNFNG